MFKQIPDFKETVDKMLDTLSNDILIHHNSLWFYNTPRQVMIKHIEVLIGRLQYLLSLIKEMSEN